MFPGLTTCQIDLAQCSFLVLCLWFTLTHILPVMPACVLQEAVRYYNLTTMQLQMLEFSRQRLVSDDEVRACVYIYVCVGAIVTVYPYK